jgi:hypothetical protein
MRNLRPRAVHALLLLVALLPAARAQACPPASFRANTVDLLTFEPWLVDINATYAGGVNRTATWWRRLSDGAFFAPLTHVAAGSAATYTTATVRVHPNVAFCGGDNYDSDPRTRATFWRAARVLPRGPREAAGIDPNDFTFAHECSGVAANAWGLSICESWKPAMGLALVCGTCQAGVNVYGDGYASVDLRGTGLCPRPPPPSCCTPRGPRPTPPSRTTPPSPSSPT